MSELKYKVGDRVRIKSIDWYNENKNRFGEICCSITVFVSTMKKYCGQIMTISQVENQYYKMKEDTNWKWTDEMINVWENDKWQDEVLDASSTIARSERPLTAQEIDNFEF